MFLASWCRLSKTQLLMTNSVGLAFQFHIEWTMQRKHFSLLLFFSVLSLFSLQWKPSPSPWGMGTPTCQLKPQIYWVSSSVYSMHIIQVLYLHTQGTSWQESSSLEKTNYHRSNYSRPLFFMDTKFSTNVNWNSTLYVSGRLIMEIDGVVSRPH